MGFELNDSEWKMLSSLPTRDLVELAADLDIVIPASVDRRALLTRCIPLIVERGRREGLPLSKYDADDIKALGRDELGALAAIQGVRASASAVLKAGAKAYKASQKVRSGHDPFAYMIPILLGPIVRYAMEQGLHR